MKTIEKVQRYESFFLWNAFWLRNIINAKCLFLCTFAASNKKY